MTRNCRPGSASVGSRPSWIRLAAALAAVVVAGSAWAQDPVERTANIQISLPAGSPRVEVVPGPERVKLDLPRGAEFPHDFSTASGGLIAGAEIRPVDERIKIDLDLASGYLDRVIYESASIVLRFRSRFAPVGDAVAEDEAYRLGADDKVRITIHNQPSLSGSLAIGRDGSITAPLVGEVQAAGLTPQQLAARLTERFDRVYLVDPQVDVEVEEYRSQWVMVGGEVRKPGRTPLRGGTRLKEIIGEAQGFTEQSGEEITISRKLEDSDETKVLRVSRRDFEAGRSNPRLTHGDLIEVARAESCYIQGEVREGGGPVRVERGMTLLKVIALAGGLTDWANRKEITVRRNDGTQENYNLNKIEAGRAEDPPMRGGEVIIVKKRFL